MIPNREKFPKVIRNLSAAHIWRPQDMVNWHRMVKPLRSLRCEQEEFDMFQLIFDVCMSLAIDYKPHESMASMQLPVTDLAHPLTRPRVGHFFDSPEHTSGVATTLGSWAEQSQLAGVDYRLYSAGFDTRLRHSVCFPPLGTLKLEAYDGLHLHVPRVTEVMDYIEREELDAIHVSSPGPMGLLGLMISRMHGIPVCGTYHTDFPRYAVELTGRPELEETTWLYMKWFYGQMDYVAAPSASTRDSLLAGGFNADKVKVVGRGVDISAFSPDFRDETLRAEWGIRQPHKLLYVGRISEEKNLSCLVGAFRHLVQKRQDVCLIVVGEGPYLETMQRELAGLPVHFPGIRKGEELARIYASSDLFLFPSLTDTFGVVLIEAQASGLPVVVSSKGGPKDTMKHGETGVILEQMSPDGMSEAVDRLLCEPERVASMSAAARKHALGFTPRASFDAFWRVNTQAIRQTSSPANGMVPKHTAYT